MKIEPRILFVFLSLVIMILAFVSYIHQFLSSQNPVKPEILIFESWIYHIDNSVQEAAHEFRKGQYKYLIAVGFHDGLNSTLKDDGVTSRAEQALIKCGLNKDDIFQVNVPSVQKHQTFSLALGCRIWLESNRIDCKNINIFTFGPHARKSEVVFKQVFEPEYNVGILSAKPVHYNPKFWWCSWAGIQWVFYDTIKYLAALIC